MMVPLGMGGKHDKPIGSQDPVTAPQTHSQKSRLGLLDPGL